VAEICKIENEKLKKIFQRKKSIVELSIERIVEKIKKEKKKNKTIREIFEGL